MAKRSEKREQFLQDLLVTAVEGGIDYWANFQSIVKITKEDDYIGWWYESVNIIDEDNESYVINHETIVKGINLLVKRNAERDKALILANRTNGDEGDFDALDADKIVQFGLFGELVYA